MTPPVLAIICPCYNEEETIEWSVEQLQQKIQQLIADNLIHSNSFICLVDDGSQDNTWSLIEAENTKNKNNIRGLKLAWNVGHQNALTAGLHSVTNQCDCSISIDVDLQSDLAAIDLMLEQFKQGAEIVFGVRDGRETDSWSKRFFSQKYYHLLKLMGVNSIANHADYRLLSNKAMEYFKKTPERNLYLRGLFANMPLKKAEILYKHGHRQFGSTKYTPLKMLELAWNGISSFSITPLRFIAAMGAIAFVASLIYIAYAVFVKFFTDSTLPGWTSTIISIYLIGGLQLLALGLIGEYVGKILLEIKQRPLYIIEYSIDKNS